MLPGVSKPGAGAFRAIFLVIKLKKFTGRCLAQTTFSVGSMPLLGNPAI